MTTRAKSAWRVRKRFRLILEWRTLFKYWYIPPPSRFQVSLSLSLLTCIPLSIIPKTQFSSFLSSAMSELYSSSNIFSTKYSILIIPSSSRQYSRYSFRNRINNYSHHHSYYFEEPFLSTQPIRLIIFFIFLTTQSFEEFKHMGFPLLEYHRKSSKLARCNEPRMPFRWKPC